MARKVKQEFAYGALKMIRSQPTPYPLAEGELYRISAIKVSKVDGTTAATLIGPVTTPDGIHEALDRILSWHEWYKHLGEPQESPYFYTAGEERKFVLQEDVAKVRLWQNLIMGERREDGAESDEGDEAVEGG